MLYSAHLFNECVIMSAAILNRSIPLAERMRPTTLDTYIGQKHLVGKGAILNRAITSGNIPSMIFWGPPGVGKTTLANIISKQLNICRFQKLKT